MNEHASPAAPTAAGRAPTRRRELPPQSNRPFQLMVVCPGTGGGDVDRSLADSVHVLDTASALDAPASFARLGLSPADLRSRAIFLVEEGADPATAMASYAVVVGFASRFIDVATPGGVVVTAHHAAGRGLADEGKAPTRADLAVVVGPGAQLDAALPDAVLGEEAADADISVTLFDATDGLAPLGAGGVSQLRSARRAVLAASPEPAQGFRELLELSGARSRRNFERLPLVACGGDPVDLDEMRRAGAELRKEHRAYSVATAPSAPPTARQELLRAAASTDVRHVLAALGSECGGELWQCPRPWSHTHGDATPSMQVSEDNAVRCYVDDAEWMDPMRLVMDVCDVTADRAAELLGDLDALAPWRDRVVAERARRA